MWPNSEYGVALNTSQLDYVITEQYAHTSCIWPTLNATNMCDDCISFSRIQSHIWCNITVTTLCMSKARCIWDSVSHIGFVLCCWFPAGLLTRTGVSPRSEPGQALSAQNASWLDLGSLGYNCIPPKQWFWFYHRLKWYFLIMPRKWQTQVIKIISTKGHRERCTENALSYDHHTSFDGKSSLQF